MKLDFNLNLTQEQKLIMTQQMQLSIKLLQMSTYDLREYIENEFVENPILEGDFDFVQEDKAYEDKIDYKEMIKYLEFDNYSSQSYGEYNKDEDVSPFNFISQKESLTEYLNNQLIESDEDEYKKAIVSYMIENIDSRGYLDMPLEDICKELNISLELGQEALEILQDLEPDGIGARNLKECLKIQLIKLGVLDDNLERIIDEYLDLIADNKFNIIAKNLKITPKEAQDLGDVIKKLEPKPSRGFYTGEEVKFIIPDAAIRKIDGQYFVIMNDGVIPRLSISSIYKDILNNKDDKKTENYVKEKLNNAMFLIKSIEQRKSTLLRILEKVVDKQMEYFDKGQKYLRPMTLKDMAEELGIHESTVSRAIKDKYILTSFGTVKIKDLFTTGLSQVQGNGEDIAVVNIKKQIKEMIDNEDKKKPLSDQIICDELNKKNLNISRRTVAKYREEMEIKSSSKRKRIE
ncbi:RNA polymerase sigma-54 factor 1 [bioreactor metagenome]|jgi:RNA polymerase sigma-54 factor|uniref:RNA polymerase factor sigma-54 n=2 Tax=root TaxID=1 RepID=R9BUL0_9CLOT|nr:RNA polymerase factor sigma-54 [Clostridium sartagoforme]EOR20355.1 RNA polymerase factor sigma-54 [Clostridium sartagoforme AAU1]